MKRFVCVLMCALCAGLLSVSAAPARAETADTHQLETQCLEAILSFRARAQRTMDIQHARFVDELDDMVARGATPTEINNMHRHYRLVVGSISRESIQTMNQVKADGVKLMRGAPHNSPGRAERILNWYWGHMGQLLVYRNSMWEDMRARTQSAVLAVR